MAGTRAHVAATAVALRVLLPAYDGPPVTLFRGTTLSEWDMFAFGFSWTTGHGTAICFAKAHEDRWVPSCVLHTLAGPDAIICASSAAIGGSSEGENEFILDPFRLSAVFRIHIDARPH